MATQGGEVESRREEIKGRLMALEDRGLYHDREAWKSAVCVFAGRCALRVMPLCGRSGDFAFWGKDAAKHMMAVETSALLAAGHGRFSIDRESYAAYAATPAASAYAAAAGSVATSYAAAYAASAYAAAAYAASSAASAPDASATSAYAAYAAAPTSAAAYASAPASAAAYGDLEILESGTAESLEDAPLWLSKMPKEFSELLPHFQKALASIDALDIYDRYESFLAGKPDWGQIERLIAQRLASASTDPSSGPKKAKGATKRGKTAAGRETPQSEAPASEPENLHVDPHGLSDSADPDDKLGYDRYADGVAAFLLSERTRPPLRISIEGSWGCGKSSFLLNLRKKLGDLVAAEKSSRKLKSMWFNPWRHDAGEALWAAFAVEFERQLMSPGDKRRRGWKRLARWEHATVFIAICLACLASLWLWWGLELDNATKWPLLAGLLAGGTYAFDHLLAMWNHPLRAEITKILKTENYGERVSAIEKFHKDFAEMVRTASGGERIFVFIDDLDRCSVPRSAELLESLTLLVSPSGTEACEESGEEGKPAPIIFVLGLDREKVAAGVAVKYEKLLPYVREDFDEANPAQRRRAGLSFGYNFIEKFIELSYQLPRPRPENIRIFLKKSLDWKSSKKASAVVGPPSVSHIIPVASHSGSRTEGPLPKAENLIRMTHAEHATVETGRQTAEQAEDKAKTVEKLENTDLIGDVAMMAASLFDNNPRRLKQFINVFRLRAHLAAQTEILGRSKGLSLQQLGKFVALELLQPDFLADAAEVLGKDFEPVVALMKKMQAGAPAALVSEPNGVGSFVEKHASVLSRADIYNFMRERPPRENAIEEEWDLNYANLLAAVVLAAPVETSGTAASGEARE